MQEFLLGLQILKKFGILRKMQSKLQCHSVKNGVILSVAKDLSESKCLQAFLNANKILRRYAPQNDRLI